ncbi:MAG TPA: hypothetical protein VGJ14_11810 [Sporichthyaceae bacterium]|jgi:hypothetical protein
MTPDSAQPRTGSVRGWSLVAAVFALLLTGSLLAAPSASAATGPDPYDPKNIKVSIKRANLDHAVSPNYITMDIIVVNADGTPPTANYGVFLTFNQPGKDPTDNPANCQQEHYNSPDIPLGVYRCTGIISAPGKWEFHGTVNKPAVQLQTVLKEVAVTLNITDAVKLRCESCGLQYIVKGKTFEVFLLQFHVVMAGLWLLLAGAMAFLAIPRLRRTMSVLTLHTLEVRRGFLTSLMWAAFAGTLGTGLFLLGTQTAYKAPYSTNAFSHQKWEAVTRLPYARDYFLVLYGKISIFLMMAAFSVILMMEAARQAQVTQDADDLDRDDDDDMWSRSVHFDEEGHIQHDDVVVAGGAGGSVATAPVQARRRTTGAVGISPRTLWVAAGVLLAGTASIGVCVTLLKYLHELIESTVAATVLGGGG